jgi:hypothetical protein
MLLGHECLRREFHTRNLNRIRVAVVSRQDAVAERIAAFDNAVGTVIHGHALFQVVFPGDSGTGVTVILSPRRHSPIEVVILELDGPLRRETFADEKVSIRLKDTAQLVEVVVNLRETHVSHFGPPGGCPKSCTRTAFEAES